MQTDKLKASDVFDPRSDAAFFADITGGRPVARELQAAVHGLAKAMLTVDVLPPGVPNRNRWQALLREAHDVLVARLAGAASGSATPTEPAVEVLAEIAAQIFAAKWHTILGEAREADRWANRPSRRVRLLDALWGHLTPPVAQPAAKLQPDEQGWIDALQQAWGAVAAARRDRRPIEPALQGLMRAAQAGVVAFWAQLLAACQALDAMLPCEAAGHAFEGLQGITGPAKL